MEQWIEAGLDIDQVNQKGTTLLMVASYYGLEHIVEYLVAEGANVSLANHGRYTALIIATCKHHVSIAKRLIESSKKVDLRAKNHNDCSAINYADKLNNREIKNLLKAQGVTLADALLEENCNVSITTYEDIAKSLF